MRFFIIIILTVFAIICLLFYLRKESPSSQGGNVVTTKSENRSITQSRKVAPLKESQENEEEEEEGEESFYAELIEMPYRDGEPSPFFDGMIFQEDLSELLELTPEQQREVAEWKRAKHHYIRDLFIAANGDPDREDDIVIDHMNNDELDEEFLQHSGKYLEDKQYQKLADNIKQRQENEYELVLNRSFQRIIRVVPDADPKQKEQLWEVMDAYNQMFTTKKGVIDMDEARSASKYRDDQLKTILTPRQYELYKEKHK